MGETAPSNLTASDFMADLAPSGGFPPEVVEGVTVGGKPVYVARLTAGEQGELYEEMDKQPQRLRRAAMLAYAIRTAGGQRVFGPEGVAHTAHFDGTKAAAVVAKFLEVNGMGGGN